MKKLFVSLLAIAGLVACTNDEVVSVQQGNPIAFDTFVENTTRVGYDSNNLNGFDVWAFMDNVEGVVLTDEDVTGGKGSFSYVNTQYWVPGHTYYFAALAPMNSANVVKTLATGDAALKGLGTLVFTNVNGTEDLLYAATKVEANDQQGAVTFQFNHLLSKVKFSFTNTFDNGNYSIKVRNIQMTAPKTGTIDLTAGEYAWTILAGEPSTLVYGDALDYGDALVDGDETDIAAMGKTVSPADERLTIPAGDTQEYIVTFDVDLYVGSTLAKTYNKKSEISGIELEAGKAYNFAADINAVSLNLDKVVFDANVDEWVEDNGAPDFVPYFVEVDGINYDDFAEAVAKAMELNKPVKFFQHVAIDADATITVPADKTLALELNGYTLTGVTDQAGANRDMFTVYGTMNVNGAPLTRAAATGNGVISVKHIGADMGQDNCTDIFRVLGDGKLNLNGVTAKNLGGTKLAYVVDMSDASNLSVNITNSTLESTYVPVRVFNNMGKHTVTIKDTSLTGKKCCIWVQFEGAYGSDPTIALEGTNTLTTEGTYQIVITDGSDENYVKPTGTYILTGADAYDVFPEPYPVATWDEFTAALAAGENWIKLTADISTSASYTLIQDLKLELNGKTLAIEGAKNRFNIGNKNDSSKPKPTVTIKNGNLNCKVYAQTGNLTLTDIKFGGSIAYTSDAQGVITVGSANLLAERCDMASVTASAPEARPRALSTEGCSNGYLILRDCNFPSSSDGTGAWVKTKLLRTYINPLSGSAELEITNCKFGVACNIELSASYIWTNMNITGCSGGFTFIISRASTSFTDEETAIMKNIKKNNSGDVRLDWTDVQKMYIY